VRLFRVLCGSAFLFLSGLQAQTPPEAVLVFEFDHPQLAVPRYTITVHADGSGSYRAVYKPERPKYASPSQVVQPGSDAPVVRTLMLSAATTAKLFEAARTAGHFQGACESKAGNVAFTGTKTLSYTAPGEHGSCAFNYTENKPVDEFTKMMQGIAYTLDDGRLLQQHHRFDRLALDADLINLADAVRTGRAQELENIAPVLRAVADDAQVLERVRSRARKLLEQSASAD
jgi:hypothetical protein